MDALIATLVLSFGPASGAILTALISWGVVEISRFVRMRTKSERVNDAVAHICHTVETTVAELNQTMVPAMRKVTADGKISAADVELLSSIARNKVAKQIPSVIKQAAGLAVNSVQAMIEGKIQKAVVDQKNRNVVGFLDADILESSTPQPESLKA